MKVIGLDFALLGILSRCYGSEAMSDGHFRAEKIAGSTIFFSIINLKIKNKRGERNIYEQLTCCLYILGKNILLEMRCGNPFLQLKES